MKNSLTIAITTTLLITASSATLVYANVDCRAKALSAAEAAYGNDPATTQVKTVKPGSKYKVTVGIGNEEDGPRTYNIFFPKGCNFDPTVKDVTRQ